MYRIFLPIKATIFSVKYMFKKLKLNLDKITEKVESSNSETPISDSLQYNISYLKEKFGDSFDIIYKYSDVGKSKVCFVMADGMCNNMLVVEQIMRPILTAEKLPSEPREMLNYISANVVAGIDQSETQTLEKAITDVLSGLVVFFVDGADLCWSYGVQGFPKRSIDDAQSEVQEKGAHEGFTESFKDNVALLRRRIRSPVLKCEVIEVGETSKTRVCVCYMSDRAKPKTVKEIKSRLKNAKLDTVLGSGYLRPFLENGEFSFFSSLGTTERPDIACGEMNEGRVIILTDGTPFALIAPYIFIENFQTMDDYNMRPFYVAFIRLLKYVSFFTAVFLPGIYVALCTFHQEVLPISMLYDMAIQESITPFPVMLETIFIHFVYEIVREAGLRMPKTVGHAVSIVGGLVIGDAAVSAGLVAAPMLIVVAISAITSFVVPHLYQSVAVLRFLLMVIGGFFGFYGIVICFCVLLVDLCKDGPYEVSELSPLAPFAPAAMRDTFMRLDWRKLGDRDLRIQNMEK